MRIRLLPLALSLFLFLAACSSDDGKAPAATPPAATNAAAGAAATASGDTPPSAFQDALSQYEAAARDYITAIDAGTPAPKLTTHLDSLLAIAEKLLPGFLDLQPHCRDYLQSALALKDTWTTLSAEEIEAGYHKDGKLPKIDNAGACYHFKDLIVHPITAQALLTESGDNRAAARHEIDEVIAHLAVVRATR